MPRHEEPLFPRSFFSRRLFIYDTPRKTFPVYHGTNLHELVLREEEEEEEGLSSVLPQTNPPCFIVCYVRVQGRRSGRAISRRMYFHRRFLPSLLLNLHRYCRYQFSKQCNPILSLPAFSTLFSTYRIFHASRDERVPREEEREREERHVTIVVKENFIS